MHRVKLCGYLTQKDKFKQYHIKYCDDFDDKQNTKYKLRQLKKTGGTNPVKPGKFIVKTKSTPVFYDTEKNMVESEKIMGSLVEVEANFRHYSFKNKYGWSLDLISCRAI